MSSELPPGSGLPDKDLLESTHSFPCQYTFKVIGIADEQFIGRVLAVVKSRLDESAEPAFSSRGTTSGRHLSVTISPDVESADHILEIYQELQQLEGLVLLM